MTRGDPVVMRMQVEACSMFRIMKGTLEVKLECFRSLDKALRGVIR